MNAHTLPPRVPHVPNPRPDWAICNDCEGHGSFAYATRYGGEAYGELAQGDDCYNCNGEGGWTVCIYCGDPECDCDPADYALTFVERIAPGRIAA